jgi:DNA invertase Pin-like site-specific DNA recombinase
MIVGYARVSTDGRTVDAQAKQLRNAGLWRARSLKRGPRDRVASRRNEKGTLETGCPFFGTIDR